MNLSRHFRFAKVCFVILAAWVRLGAVTSSDAQTAAGSTSATGASPSGLWQDVQEKSVLAARGNLSVAQARHGIIPGNYRTLHLDRTLLAARLAAAPQEFAHRTPSANAPAALEIELPIPGSTRFARFEVAESPVMAAGLAARYPEIHTYTARGIDNPALAARLDVTPHGFHALILAPSGQVYIDPYFADGSDLETTIAYYKNDYLGKPFDCLVHSPAPAVSKEALARAETSLSRPTGANLRIYRLALAATAEYTAAVGGGSVDDDGTFISPGTVAGALGAMVTIVNRVDAVYERDFAIRMVLIDNTDQLIYLNPNTDPYTNEDGGAMLDENQNNLDTLIGDANYDIGHVFSTGGGGIAGLGVVSASGFKAEGVTGLPNPVGDPYAIDYVAHEMGHQFGANHPFNSTTGACGGGNRNASTAYEPGSGTTIMAYAGICSAATVQDLAPHSDDYFHTISYDEIDIYTTSGDGQNAFQTIPTGNAPPVFSLPTAYAIPISTPFALTATATDADGDKLTYCWEEFDKGAAVDATTLAGLDNGASPIFRSYAPTTSPTRLFPSLTYILNNANVPPLHDTTGYLIGEALPSKAHPNGLNFRCTVRDNRLGGGGSNYAGVKLTVVPAAGPFVITAPNTATTLAGGSTQTVAWNVAGTTAPPVNCANVKISLSTDGGLTFPYVLAASTPNNGSAVVMLPNTGNVATKQARLKVEAVGNIFFDISDADFAITSANTPPTFAATGTGLTIVRGTPTDTVTIVGTVTPGTNALSSVSVLGLPDGLTITPSLSGSSVSLSGSAECRLTTTNTTRTYPISVTVTDAAGSTVSGKVNVLIAPNPSPTLGEYTSTSVAQNDMATVNPSAGLADANFNLPASPFTVLPTALPGGGTITVDQTTGTVSIVPTTDSTLGTTAVRVTAQDDCGAATVKIFNVTVTVPVNPAPIINSTLTASGVVASAFNYQITATHSPTSFGATGLPAGLQVNPTTGLISGTPTQAGTFSVTLSATNTFGTGTATLRLTIGAEPVPSVNSSGIESTKVGLPYYYQIGGTNSPTGFTASPLPPGLSLNAVTGVITGTPSQVGVYQISLSATNFGGTGTGTLFLTVADIVPVATLSDSVPTVTAGSGNIGEIRVNLSSAQPDIVYVYYTIKGTAVNGTDYVLLTGRKKFKPGKTSKPIKIVPLSNLEGAVQKTVKIVLTPGTGYTLGTVSTAKVKIVAGP